MYICNILVCIRLITLTSGEHNGYAFETSETIYIYDKTLKEKCRVGITVTEHCSWRFVASY